MTLPEIPTEVGYVALLFLLFVVPRFLQRYRVPSAVTAMAFGAVAGMGFDVLRDDPTVTLLSTLGIVSLFLFAGLDVSIQELRREAYVLSEHLLLKILGLVAASWILAYLFGLGVRASLLVTLALLTPSTGFILDSLGRWGLSEDERFWIRSKAIAAELLALAVLFVALQSTSWTELGLSALALIAIVAVLPVVFRWFAKAVVPHAPNSEFGFLMMMAALCAVGTAALGVYYLVGAFTVGMAAQQFRRQLPSIASLRMLGAVESFASLFVPFYFFHAGLALRQENFSLAALGLGLAFCLVALPIRLAQVVVHRSIRLGEPRAKSVRVGVPMLPTTVFTLVLATILQQEFAIPTALFGGLIIYTLVNTLIPGFVMRAPAPEFADELLIAGAAAAATPAATAAKPPSTPSLPQAPPVSEQPVDTGPTRP